MLSPPVETSPATPRPGPAARWLRLRTVPGRIRALSAVVVVVIAGLFAVAFSYVGDARDGLRVIGHGAGPQVVATSDLYFALSDMDAQIAGVLLIGRDTGLGIGRDNALAKYQSDLATANKAVVQAADLARGDKAGQATVQSVLNSLGRYEQLVGQALALDAANPHSAGPPSAQVTRLYQQATEVMKLKLLPQAYNLTLDSGAIVRRTYEAKRSSVLAGRFWVLGAGLVTLALMAGLQLYLTAGFRRVVNPFLALSTVGVLVLTAATMLLLNGEAGHLRKAKAEGFDSILALSRARAIGNSASGDESRFLLFQQNQAVADTYEQVYLDKSQSILFVHSDKAIDLGTYDRLLAQNLTAYAGNPAKVPFLGFFGKEADSGRGTALSAALSDYQQFQQDDQKMRTLAAAGNLRSAIEVRMGRGDGASGHDFDAYDQAVVRLIELHRTTFDQAITDGDGELGGWSWGLPVGAVVLALLVVAGVQPRLKEFR